MKKKFLVTVIIALGTTMFIPSIIVKGENNILISPQKLNRLFGANRYETSAQISKEGWNDKADKVIVVNGDDYPDALCSGPLAKKYNAPILLTSKDTVNDNVLNEIKRLNPKQIIIVGGTGVISENVVKTLKNIVTDIKRISGADRYETALEVAKIFENSKNVVIASGEGYADALSIAPIASHKQMPILLTSKDALNENVENYINSLKVDKAYIVGGAGVVGETVEKKIKNVVRISGKNRFETNLKVIQTFENDINFDKIYIALGDGPNGNEFADALSGTSIASKSSSAIALTNKDIDSELLKYLKNKMNSNSVITALGGESVVPNTIIEKFILEKNDLKLNNNNTSAAVDTTTNTSNTSLNQTNTNTNNNNNSGTTLPTNEGRIILEKQNIKINITNEKVYFTITTLDKINNITIKVLNNTKDSLDFIDQYSSDKNTVTFETVLSKGNYTIITNGDIAINETFDIK